jgi:hypothetical protein
MSTSELSHAKLLYSKINVIVGYCYHKNYSFVMTFSMILHVENIHSQMTCTVERITGKNYWFVIKSSILS